MVFKNVIEARLVIDQLLKSIKTNREHTKINEEKVKNLALILDATKAKCQTMLDQQESHNDLRKYYQTILLKLVRDLEVFKDDEENCDKFDEIEEFELKNDIEEQKKIMSTLRGLNLQIEMINHANKFFGQAEGLEKLQEQISQMRV